MKWLTSSRLRRVLWDAGLILAIFLILQVWQQRDMPTGKAPQTGGYLSDGTAFCLSHWFEQHPENTVVALHFWAEWCPICRTEESSVSAVGKDWPVISVAMQSGNAEAVSAYMRKAGLDWVALIDDTGRISSDYGLKGVPAFIVIDRNGRIRSVSTGYTTELGMRIRLSWANHF